MFFSFHIPNEYAFSFLKHNRHIEKIHKPCRVTDVPENVLDISLIRREVGWTPRTDWMEGLRATAAWLEEVM